MRLRAQLAALLFAVPFAALHTLDAQTTRLVPSQYPHIQDAIAASVNGDTVQVSPGTYRENLDFLGKAITVTSTGGATVTTVDGSAQIAPVVQFLHNELRNSVLRGFTLENGGALNAAPTTAQGGIYMAQAAPTIVQNILTNNTCNSVVIANSAPLLDSNDIKQTLTGSQCSYAAAAGYAPTLYGGTAILITSNPSIPANTALKGLYPIFTGNTLENNTLGTLAGAIYGGGFLATGNIIRNNAAGTGSVIGGLGLGAAFTFSGNLVYGNTSNNTGFYHAAIDLDNGGQSGGNGTGPKTLFIDNNTFYNNTAGTGFAYATDVYLGYSANVDLVNNIFSSGTYGFPPVYCYPATANSVDDVFAADHNDLYNPAGGAPAGGSCAPAIGTFGNISKDPGFANAAAGDFHLLATSPAIDAGNNSYAVNYFPAPSPPPPSPALAHDLDLESRLCDATGKGFATIDMGAFEFQSGCSSTPETLLELHPNAYEDAGGGAPMFYATLSSPLGTPTGTVQFFADGKLFSQVGADSTGLATTTGVLAPGAHAIFAQYAGTGTFSPAVSQPFYLLIDKYTPTLTLTSSNPNAVQGQPVTFTLTIHAGDTNALSPLYLYDYGGAVTLAQFTPDATGISTYTTSTLTPGTHAISAYYPGDSQHFPVRAALTQIITTATGTPTTTSVGASPTFAQLNAVITLTANVSPANAVGTVTFYDGSNPFTNGPLVNGTTTVKYSTLGVGTHVISASFTPADPTAVAPSTSTTTVTVVIQSPTPAPVNTTTALTANPTSAPAGSVVNLLAAVTAAVDQADLSGDITVTDNGSTLFQNAFAKGMPLNVPVTALSVGTHTLLAYFTPANTAAFGPSTSLPITVTITANTPTATTLAFTATPNTVNVGDPVALAASVAPSVSGTLAITDNGTPLVSQALAAGATFSDNVSTFAVGTHQLLGTFTPDSSLYLASIHVPITVTVNAVTPPPSSADFTLTPASASVSVQTTHHISTGLLLTSVNGFSGTVTLSCGPLPAFLTCELPATPPALNANGTVNAPVTLDTDAILNFALLAPLSLLFLPRRRRRKLSLAAAALLLLTLTACSGKQPGHTPPGNYTLTFTGTSGTLTHTTTLQLHVTP